IARSRGTAGCRAFPSGSPPGRGGRVQMRSAGRSRRLVAVLGAALLAAPVLTACGSDSGTTINVYYSPEQTFDKVVEKCNAQANGRYTIVYNKLPREADGQR